MTTEQNRKGRYPARNADIRIDGFSDERWHPIIKGVDLNCGAAKSWA
jgi:hypothetical protein